MSILDNEGHDPNGLGNRPQPDPAPKGGEDEPAAIVADLVARLRAFTVNRGDRETLLVHPSVCLEAADALSALTAGKAALCPRCRVNPADPVLLGTDLEGHICGVCWQNDRKADEITAGKAAGVGEEWQPIETAPKGEFVLTYGPSHTPTQVAILCFTAGKWRDDDGGWFIKGPTHWCPLPAPPAALRPAQP